MTSQYDYSPTEAADCYVADLAHHAASQPQRTVGVAIIQRCIDQLRGLEALFVSVPPAAPIPRSAIRQRLRGKPVTISRVTPDGVPDSPSSR